MNVRLTQIDGKLPNLALMKLSYWHRERGDVVHFSRSPYRDLLEPEYGAVYGSAIFDFSTDRVSKFRQEFPGAIVGGTWDVGDDLTVERYLGIPEREVYDYGPYPDFDASLGFTARGCRLKCKFCVVPGKEGPPRAVATIADIWRGSGYLKHLHLLDNDFFGQPRPDWRARLAEIRDGGFRVCFNQGINIRMIDQESAEAIASVRYYDDSFTVRRIYTAWDNLGDGERFFRGIDTLERAGIPSRHVMAYMLIGYDRRETWERLFVRFDRMKERGIRPYPMVFDPKRAHRKLPLGGYNKRIENRTLAEFSRWVIRKSYNFVDFEDYDVNARGHVESDPPRLF